MPKLKGGLERGLKGNERRSKGVQRGLKWKMEYFLECSKKFWNILKKLERSGKKSLEDFSKKFLAEEKVLRIRGKVWRSSRKSCVSIFWKVTSGWKMGGGKMAFSKISARLRRASRKEFPVNATSFWVSSFKETVRRASLKRLVLLKGLFNIIKETFKEAS